jgi:hypothetical protein
MSANDTLPPNTPSRTALELLADEGKIDAEFGSYLLQCRAECGGNPKSAGRIPNVAGFCRFLGATLSDFDRLRSTRPEIHGAICAALEDEALNSQMTATILSIYLKHRLGYSEEKKEERTVTDSGQLRLIFDHDAYEDGV